MEVIRHDTKVPKLESEDTSFAELFSRLQMQSRNDLKYSYVGFNEVEKWTSKCVFLFGYNQFLHNFDLTNGASASFDTEYHSAYANIFLTHVQKLNSIGQNLIEVTSSSSVRLRMDYNPLYLFFGYG
jgi:hypothetical protein